MGDATGEGEQSMAAGDGKKNADPSDAGQEESVRSPPSKCPLPGEFVTPPEVASSQRKSLGNASPYSSRLWLDAPRKSPGSSTGYSSRRAEATSKRHHSLVS